MYRPGAASKTFACQGSAALPFLPHAGFLNDEVALHTINFILDDEDQISLVVSYPEGISRFPIDPYAFACLYAQAQALRGILGKYEPRGRRGAAAYADPIPLGVVDLK